MHFYPGNKTVYETRKQIRGCQDVPFGLGPQFSDNNYWWTAWSDDDVKELYDFGDDVNLIHADVYTCSTNNCNTAVCHVHSIGGVMLTVLVAYVI